MVALEPWRGLLDIFELLPGMHFWIKDRKGRFISANQAFLAHLGMADIGSLKGRSDFDVSRAELAREYVRDDEIVLASGKSLKDIMEIVHDRDGSVSWYSTTKVPLRNDSGEIWGTAGFTRKVKDISSEPPPRDPLEAVADYMRERFADPISMLRLAEISGVSLAQFERKFRRTYHASPLRYLNQIRLRAACQLLSHTEMRIRDVAMNSGFADQGYFARQFHRAQGMSPREYRARLSRRQGRKSR